ncbi:MAG: flagellar motor protein MotB [Planctomycetota bacterium]
MEDDGPPGVPEWVVTYGDMMSLLLTFFIMLVSLSEVAADKKYQQVLEALQQYAGYVAAQPSPPGKHFPLNSATRRTKKLGSHVDDSKARGGIRREAVEGLDVRVFRDREGDPVPHGEPLLFAAGSVDLLPLTTPRLADIVTEVAGKPHKLQVVANYPASEDGTLPEEAIRLAYERARRVALMMEVAGIAHVRLRIVTRAITAERAARSTVPPDSVEVVSLDVTAADLQGPRIE